MTSDIKGLDDAGSHHLLGTLEHSRSQLVQWLFSEIKHIKQYVSKPHMLLITCTIIKAAIAMSQHNYKLIGIISSEQILHIDIYLSKHF